MYVFLVWLHLLAAVVWIGGMAFLSLALVPVLQHRGFSGANRELFQAVAVRFRVVVWLSVTVLLGTGPVLLARHGHSLAVPSAWPGVLLFKLTLVGALFLFTATHDVLVGPLASKAWRQPVETRSLRGRRLIATSPWIARLSLVLALIVMLAGVMLARS